MVNKLGLRFKDTHFKRGAEILNIIADAQLTTDVLFLVVRGAAETNSASALAVCSDAASIFATGGVENTKHICVKEYIVTPIQNVFCKKKTV